MDTDAIVDAVKALTAVNAHLGTQYTTHKDLKSKAFEFLGHEGFGGAQNPQWCQLAGLLRGLIRVRLLSLTLRLGTSTLDAARLSFDCRPFRVQVGATSLAAVNTILSLQ